LVHSAPITFERQPDAERWLTVVEAQIIRGQWTSPLAARVPLGEYAERWIIERRLQLPAGGTSVIVAPKA
jgi:hypothetical protein